MVFIYPSGNSDHKQDHSYKRKRRNRFWVYAIGYGDAIAVFCSDKMCGFQTVDQDRDQDQLDDDAGDRRDESGGQPRVH